MDTEDLRALAELPEQELLALLNGSPELLRQMLDIVTADTDEEARRRPEVFIPLVLKDEKTGNLVTQSAYHNKFQAALNDKRAIIYGHVEMGKALALDTPVWVPGGFATIGDLSVGDMVYDHHGNVVEVVHTTPVFYGLACYEVVTSTERGHDVVIAAADHLWLVRDWSTDADVVVDTTQLGAGDLLPSATGGADTVVLSVTPTASVPVKCISVDSPSHTFVVGNGTVTHNCVTESTLFQLEDGTMVNALELERRLRVFGQVKVLDVDPTTETHRFVPVGKVFDNGVRACRRVITAGGKETVVSANHPVWVRRDGEEGWLAAAELERGDQVLTTHVAPEVSAKGVDVTDAQRLGLVYTAAVKHQPSNAKAFWSDNGVWINLTHDGYKRPVAPYVVLAISDLFPDVHYRVSVAMSDGESTHTHGWVACDDLLTKSGGVKCREHRVGTPHVVRSWVWDNPLNLPPECMRYTREQAAHFVAAAILGITTRDKLTVSLVTQHAAGLQFMYSRAGVSVRRNLDHIRPLPEGFGSVVDVLRELAPPLAPIAAAEVGTPTPAEKAVRWDSITRVDDAGELPTWGVEIDSPWHTHVTDGILTHNTQQLIGRLLWEIGNNPNIRIAYICNVQTNAARVGATLLRYIESDPDFKRIFPNVAPGGKWTAEDFSVERGYQVTHPTFQAVGFGGSITSNRVDLLIFDDLVDKKNSMTAYMRNVVYDWITGVPLNRMTAGARTWWVHNAWHLDDAPHRQAKEPGYTTYTFPARDPVTKLPYWWTQERIEEVILNIGNPLEVARVIDCIPRSDDAGGMKQAWIDKAIEAGRNIFAPDNICYGWEGGRSPSGWSVFVGVDLAISLSARADKTAFFIFAVMPGGKKRVLRALQGRWSGVEIIQKLVMINRMYGPKRFYVESVAAQDYMRQFLNNPAMVEAATGENEVHLPILPFNTRGAGATHNKHHAQFGVQGIFTEFSAGLWQVPCVSRQYVDETAEVQAEDAPIVDVVDDDVMEFLDACMNYSSDDSHTPDILMAAWIGNEGCRASGGVNSNLVTEGKPSEAAAKHKSSRRSSAAASLWGGLADAFGEDIYREVIDVDYEVR